MNLESLMDLSFLIRLGIDLACVFVLVRLIYYRAYGRADLFLTFFAFNLAIFVISFVLNRTEMSMGAAFGLFAVFSMLRYRTEGISTTDMTYLFLGIALGLIMAIANFAPLALAGIGALLVGFTFVLELGLLSRRELRQEVLFDDVALLAPSRRGELIANIQARTGLEIHRVEIDEIDLLRDASRLAVFYYPARSVAAKRRAKPQSRT